MSKHDNSNLQRTRFGVCVVSYFLKLSAEIKEFVKIHAVMSHTLSFFIGISHRNIRPIIMFIISMVYHSYIDRITSVRRDENASENVRKQM